MQRWLGWLSVLIFTILLVLGARAHPLWGDEAETALFGRNILRCGLPCGWDGVNLMGISDAVVLNKDLINHTSPWGQYYLTAMAFKLLGEGSFQARLPFVLISILAMWPAFLIGKKLGNGWVGTLILMLTSVSVPLILFGFQDRYYAMTHLGGLLLIWSVLNLLEKKWWPKILLFTAGVIYFYGNYVSFGAFYLAGLVYGIVSNSAGNRFKFVGWYLGVGVWITMATLPWFLWMRPMAGRGEVSLPVIGLSTITYYISLLRYYFDIVPVLAVLGAGVVLRKNKQLRNLIVLLGVYLLAMAAITLLARSDTSFVLIRYNSVILVCLPIVFAISIYEFWKRNRVAGILLFIGVAFGDRLMPKYLSEAFWPYPTPDRVVADFINERAKDGETAFVTLDRDHEPLIFHLREKIKFVNRVTKNNPRIFPENKDKLPKYLYSFHENPDWVIRYSKRGNDGTFFTFDDRPLPAGVDLSMYKEYALPVFFADMSRPELSLRSFEKIEPGPMDMVYVYHLED